MPSSPGPDAGAPGQVHVQPEIDVATMVNTTSLLRVLLLATPFLMALPLRAQSPEERARAILQLFESGQKDTAYILIEPLKKEARFVPAVIYTRAQMTPDDRALNLYREVIALDPGGAWADEAAHQLVRRYVEKKDSEAAVTWLGVLRGNYPRSPYLSSSEELLASVTSWELEMPSGDQLADAGGRAIQRPASADTTHAASKPNEKAKGKEDANGKNGTAASSEPTKPSDTYRASGMRGYALQVGLFPTRAAAEKRASELARRKLKAVPLPKTVDGRKQYALIVGPYASLQAASQKKASVSKICDCPSFIVKVE